MEKFRKVTFAVLSTITVLFAANIYFLTGLYGSIKEQYLGTARECLMQADIIETMSRLKRCYNYPDSNIKVNIDLDITRRMTESGNVIAAYEQAGQSDSTAGEKLMGLFQSFNTTLAQNLHDATAELGDAPDFAALDSIFMVELNRVGLYPKRVMILRPDTAAPSSTRGMWKLDYYIMNGNRVIYRAYITPPLSAILAPTAGVIITIALIIIALAYAFFYLIGTVMKMRSIEEMKDDFTNNMTHELKTPIAVAYSATDTLLNYGKHNDPEKRERYLKIALEQLSRLGELVEHILSMSMERRKTLVLNIERVELRPFLNEIAEAHMLKAAKEVKISVDVSPEGLAIDVDPTHFGNVINNLIDNAIKYSGESVEITITATRSAIKVSDNGIGMAAKALPLIFNKFYRVPTGNRRDVRGYGIGLFYVKSIVEKAGWDIGVTSTPGKGSVFTIKFNQDEK